jgi:hypothetical protein
LHDPHVLSLVEETVADVGHGDHDTPPSRSVKAASATPNRRGRIPLDRLSSAHRSIWDRCPKRKARREPNIGA